MISNFSDPSRKKNPQIKDPHLNPYEDLSFIDTDNYRLKMNLEQLYFGKNPLLSHLIRIEKCSNLKDLYL